MMSDVKAVECPKALLQKKILWCIATDNFCLWQRHCHVKNHAVLMDEAKTCEYRQNHEGE